MTMFSVCQLRLRVGRKCDNTRLDQLNSYLYNSSSLVHLSSSDHRLTSTLIHGD